MWARSGCGRDRSRRANRKVVRRPRAGDDRSLRRAPPGISNAMRQGNSGEDVLVEPAAIRSTCECACGERLTAGRNFYLRRRYGRQHGDRPMFGKTYPEVLVVGAGPVGLCAALALAKRQVRVAIVDKEWRSGAHSYALAHACSHVGFVAGVGHSRSGAEHGLSGPHDRSV